LKKLSELYHDLFKTANDAIFVADAETGVIVDANKPAEKLIGIPVSKIKGMHQSRLHPPEEAEKYKKLFRDHIEKGNAISEDIYVVHGSGQKVPVDISASTATFGGKKVVFGIFRDITRRRQIENNLREFELIWESTFDSIPDIITIHDKSCNIIRANKSAREVLGLPDLDRRGVKCSKYFHGTDAPVKGCLALKCLKTKQSVISEAFNPHLGLFIETRAIPQFDVNDEIKGFIHVARDITERRDMEHDLRRSRQELSIQAKNLTEANAALKVLLEHREKDRKILEGKILSNIKTLVLPYMEKLKKVNNEPVALNYINILESNLKDIVSPFSTRLSSQLIGFTPKEILVANLIKEGRQSKEIADMMGVSFETVNCHRQNIRKKLDLANKKTNLQSYLMSLPD